MYSEETLQNIGKIDLIKLISEFVPLHEEDGAIVGNCPFHGDGKDETLVIIGNEYHCMDPDCGASGNAVSFVMSTMHISCMEAVDFLAKREGFTVRKVYAEIEEEKERLKDSLRKNSAKPQEADFGIFKKAKAAEDAISDAKDFYISMRDKTDYWNKRGVSPQMQEKFWLGYTGKSVYGNMHPLYDRLRGKHGVEALENAGLSKLTADGKHRVDMFWDRAMIPIRDYVGHPIGFGGRILGDGKPKYLNTSETMLFDKSCVLFAMNFAKYTRESYMILCEGYMDVITMHQFGFTNTVASLGTALTPEQAGIIAHVRKKVVIMYDSDVPGITAAKRAIPILKDAGISPFVATVKGGKDPDELLHSEGAGAMRKVISDAEPGDVFLFRGRNPKTKEAKEEFFSDLVKLL